MKPNLIYPCLSQWHVKSIWNQAFMTVCSYWWHNCLMQRMMSLSPWQEHNWVVAWENSTFYRDTTTPSNTTKLWHVSSSALPVGETVHLVASAIGMPRVADLVAFYRGHCSLLPSIVRPLKVPCKWFLYQFPGLAVDTLYQRCRQHSVAMLKGQPCPESLTKPVFNRMHSCQMTHLLSGQPTPSNSTCTTPISIQTYKYVSSPTPTNMCYAAIMAHKTNFLKLENICPHLAGREQLH